MKINVCLVFSYLFFNCHFLARCCSDALHNCHRLLKDVCPLLSVPAQVQKRVPLQLHHDYAVCRTYEVSLFAIL